MMTIITANPVSGHFNIAIVTSRFNEHVTEKLFAGAHARLLEHGYSEQQVTSMTVPGAVEIPVIAQSLAMSGRYAAIICLGAVIRGETSHYDYVCEQVSQGCQRVALDHGIPIIFGVLTTENDEQALERCGGKHGHKGREAADGAVEMIALLGQIKD
jgi:6,7-dimethyl-8-ribityllumazine synthase